MGSPEVLSPTRAFLGEGLSWDPARQVLWWVDIFPGRIYELDPATGGERVYVAPSSVGSVCPSSDGRQLIAALRDGFHVLDLTTGEFTPVATVDDLGPFERFNDGRTDRSGRFWSGTVAEGDPDPDSRLGSLYLLRPNGKAERKLSGIVSSNGLAFSPGGELMYFADSQGGFVWKFFLDPETGEIAGREVFIDFRDDEGCVDGATVDSEGCYWAAMPESGRIQRYSPQGGKLESYFLPTPIVTCCEFGGPGMTTLFATSAHFDRMPGDPLAGAVFAVEVDAKGIPNTPYSRP